MSLKSAFASKVYKARKQMGLTQSQVAEAVSVSLRWYQQIEKGIHPPGATVMLRLIILMNLDPQDFKGEVGINEKVLLSSHKTNPHV